ncbi:MAG: hypothetical protein J0I79_25160 [Mesorhizobium sp.]|uniref:hypothetical protein n=1 Tax=Mesorhizobium sp. TaxID=1871066 RepID=UPI001AC0233D|nr:hypothetical protein [Mesorhizobium sp.]MBN9221249.1 hypothetical protein [Mesorhizobium sp.]
MKVSPKLTFPHPPARPNELPDFSKLNIPPAGSLGIPSPDAAPEEYRPFAEGMIRVLDEHGRAVGPWADLTKAIGPDRLRQGLRDMMRIRAVDKRLLTAQRQGKTSFYLQCTGEEAIGCGFAGGRQ